MPASTEHFAVAAANFSIGLVRPAIVGIVPPWRMIRASSCFTDTCGWMYSSSREVVGGDGADSDGNSVEGQLGNGMCRGGVRNGYVSSVFFDGCERDRVFQAKDR